MASAPNHRGRAATPAYVARGEKKTPKIRETRLLGVASAGTAGIAACNLVRVSSIFPPGCRILSRAQGAKRLEPGQVTFVVMSEAATREPHRLIAATVGVAIPRNRDLYGYLSEHHSFGESEDIAGDYAEELAAEMRSEER